jgi:hypothetical protein
MLVHAWVLRYSTADLVLLELSRAAVHAAQLAEVSYLQRNLVGNLANTHLVDQKGDEG